jgi:hypothetical protein
MTTENIDFTAILAVLEAKRAALDALIGSYRAALSLGALGQPGDVDMGAFTSVGAGSNATPTLGGPPIELPNGAFLGKSIGAAIKLYLAAVRRKQTTKEITAALKEGGVESTSDKFESVVLASLGSLKRGGDVLRFKDGWALAEFYPAHLRGSLTAGKDTKSGAKKRSRARSARKAGGDKKPAAARKGGVVKMTRRPRAVSSTTEAPDASEQGAA